MKEMNQRAMKEIMKISAKIMWRNESGINGNMKIKQ
jgi:hypothetical protein